MRTSGRYRTPTGVKDEFRAYPRRALIITTVLAESRAVQAHLVDIEELVSEKGAYYEYGRFPDPDGDWRVVHAITAQGNSDAGLTASKAHQDFGAFDAVMFVGVAGSLKEDIPVGSVVVGDYVYNAHSAKVEDKETLSRPHGHAAAPELLSATRALIYSRKWTDLIRPPTDMTELPSKNDYPCGYPPEGTIKAIASGEEVIAGGKSRRYVWLRKTFNDAGAVEMEGWGVMNVAHIETTPAIIVRGISDMCVGKDHVKDKLHQPIASVHAAAFAFSVLSFRSRALPVAPDNAMTEPVESASEIATAEDPRVEYVVNFKGSKEDWSAGKAQAVVDRLKELTGDPDLVLVRIEPGSVRLVVSVRESDIPSLDLSSLRRATSATGATLLGATSADNARDAEAAKVALRDASANLLGWERTLPGGAWIERPERAEIEGRFDSENSSTVLLGDPGSGKSALLSKLAADLIDAGATVFALKSDFISTDVRNEGDLQRDLQLPALPSDLILRLARLQPVFVFIDQLDALASQLDLRSDRLNVLLNLVRRIGGVSNVHIVLSARTFEFNHDVRLRAVEAEAVTLSLPAWHEVKAKLAEANIDAEMWPEKARDLVRIPQALKTYLTLATSSSSEPFTKYQSMLEELWRERIASANDGEKLAELASDLAEEMAEEEALWLAASKFDSRLNALRRLEAVGFIVRSENGLSVAFSHQTVFDYVLARTFVRSVGLLSTYVLERQDSLFVRAKLWSALNYLREAQTSAYEREFLTIWRAEPLRRHIRLLLIEFLGQLTQPFAFEKLCLEEIMKLSDLRIFGLKAITNSPGWFATFARTAIREAMVGSDAEAGHALRILVGAWKSDDQEVIRLIREQWLPVLERDTYSWTAVQECPRWTPEVEEMARIILSRTSIAIWQVDYAAQTLAVDQPDVALKLVRAKLDFILEEAKRVPPAKPYPEDGTADEHAVWYLEHRPTKAFDAILETMEWNGLPAIAEAEPATFVASLWPWYADLFAQIIARANRDEAAYVYPGQYILELDFSESTSRSGGREKPVTTSVQLAIEGFAEADPDGFATWADANSGREILAVQQLIARGYELAAAHLASKAHTWLLQDQRRFQLGTSRGHRHSTVNVIRSASPHWSADELKAFEERVLGYRPPVPDHLKSAEQRKLFADVIRATKMELLRAVGVDRLQPASRELVTTEQRALGNRLERSVSDIEAGWIGPPMDAPAMTRAKDRDILRIFAEIPDNSNWDHPTSWMRGGNIQLSRAFAEFSRANPERGLRIMEQFEPHRQGRAAGYALDAMADDAENDTALMDALLDLHQRGFGSDEFKDSAARAIEKIANRKTRVGEDIINLLIEWLKHNPDERPAEVDANEESVAAEEEEVLRDGSLLWGLGTSTSLPQGNYNVLSALASILFIHKETGRDRLLVILKDHLAREKDPNVWKALLYRLGNAGGSTPQVVSEFLRALFARFPQILASREGIIFLAYAQRWDDQLIFDLIADWPKSQKALLQRAYGELVGLVATAKGREPWVRARKDVLESGTEEAKIGLANAAVNMWRDDKFHEKAGTTLIQLVVGADSRLIAAILDVFRVIDDLVPDATTVAFLKAIADPHVDLSGAPSLYVVEKLQGLLPHEAELVTAIAAKLILAWRDELGDSSTGTAMAAPQLTDLALTLHRLGAPSREAGAAIFEAMIELDAHGARDTLVEIDGRFGQHQATARRRIGRRKTKRRHQGAPIQPLQPPSSR